MRETRRTLSIPGIISLFVVSVLFVFLGASPVAQPLRAGIGAALLPVFKSTGRMAVTVRGLFWEGEGRKAEWERDRESVLAELARLADAARENETLKQALALREEGETGVLAATVIGFLREGREEFILLNRGTLDGVSEGDLVLSSGRALGGVVTNVSPRSARVALFTSASRSIDVSIARTGFRAIARGNNNRELVVELVPQDADVVSGDLLVASPRATLGERSLVLGEVREIEKAEHEVFQTIRAIHAFDPADDSVLILFGQTSS